MAAGDAIRLYHRLTCYGPRRDDIQPPAEHPLVLRDFVRNDRATWPAPCKAYPGDHMVVELPRDWPRIETPATAVLAGRAATAQAPLDLHTLARLFHLSAGVVRSSERSDGRVILFRAAGSAGARFPLEVYLSGRGVDGLPDAVYWYDPLNHALVQVGPAAGGELTTVVLTGLPWRTGWQYAERGYRHIYWDAGSMLAQTLALADSAGLEPRLWTRFADADVAALVGADGVHESPVALVSFGTGRPAIQPQGQAAAGVVDSATVEFPLITHAQHAGDADSLGDPWPPAGAPVAMGPAASPDLDDVILRRGSTRVFDAAATVPKAVFEFTLAASLRGSQVPHFIAVHGVDEVEPGLYRWPDLGEPLRRGSLREHLLWVCWDMNLARDAAYVVMSAINLDGIDYHGYREAQLEAGIVEGRLHLAAFALGIGASGMTFLDSEIEWLLGEPLAGLLFTCIGVPTYRNRAGGPPREPVSITGGPKGFPPADETPASRPR